MKRKDRNRSVDNSETERTARCVLYPFLVSVALTSITLYQLYKFSPFFAYE